MKIEKLLSNTFNLCHKLLILFLFYYTLINIIVLIRLEIETVLKLNVSNELDLNYLILLS